MTNKEKFLQDFIDQHLLGIQTMYNTTSKESYESFESFISEVTPSLSLEYDKLFCKNLTDNEISTQLFYLINQICKSKKSTAKTNILKDKHYLCPGCLYFDKHNVLSGNKNLKCNLCQEKLKTTQNTQENLFYKTFASHGIMGYRCQDCLRFIPKPDTLAAEIVCPYFDCLFVGSADSLKKMHHPIVKEDVSSFENSNSNLNEIISSSKTSHIKEIINYQLNNLVYTSFNFTLKHKVLVYQAFLQLLDQFPQEMSDYLLHQSRSGGFQHKVFQKYISLLEESFPFIIKKNGKTIRIDNLLDNNLCLFDGISTFEALTNKKTIKNNTQEYYIGGRAASYTKPYYIGKLLNIVRKDNKESLMNLVAEYSFSKIKLADIEDNIPVVVTHLRVPPHYQMGGMVYVNRIRKKIVDALIE